MTILLRIICLIIGYACGLLETGVLYGKLKGVDIREHGSGNSGTTNALRVLGPKAGLVVFIGDFCKSFIPCLIARFVFKGMYPDTYLLYVLYTGFGAVLGHNFPFYLKFKGGKGVATTAGTIVGLLNPILIVVLLILFVIVELITRYVSLGSILLMIELTILYGVLLFTNHLCFDMSVASSKAAGIESFVLIILFSALCIFRHRANIGRLMRHEENKLSFSKKDKPEEDKKEK